MVSSSTVGIVVEGIKPVLFFFFEISFGSLFLALHTSHPFRANLWSLGRCPVVRCQCLPPVPFLWLTLEKILLGVATDTTILKTLSAPVSQGTRV